LMDVFQRESNIDLQPDRTALQRMREAAEKANPALTVA